MVSRLVQLRHDPVKRLQNLIMRLNTDQGDFIQMRMEYLDPFAMDELQRADSIMEPWSIQAIDILPEVSDDELRQLQDDDPSIGPIKEMIAQGEAPTIDTLRSLPVEARKIWSLRQTVVIQNNSLVRRDEDRTKLLVPTSLRERLFTHAHGGPLAAHLGSQRTLAQLKQLYYWPGMGKDVESWYKQCQDCATSK